MPYTEDISKIDRSKFGPDAPTFADLGTGSFDGEVRYVVSEDKYYFWNGTDWVELQTPTTNIDAGDTQLKYRIIQVWRQAGADPVPTTLNYGEFFVDSAGTIYVGDATGTPVQIAGGGGVTPTLEQVLAAGSQADKAGASFILRDGGVAYGPVISNIFDDATNRISTVLASTELTVGAPDTLLTLGTILNDTAFTVVAGDRIELGVDLLAMATPVQIAGVTPGALFNSTYCIIKSDSANAGTYVVVGVTDGVTTNSVAILANLDGSVPNITSAGTAKLFNLRTSQGKGGDGGTSLAVSYGYDTKNVHVTAAYGDYAQPGLDGGVHVTYWSGTQADGIINLINYGGGSAYYLRLGGAASDKPDIKLLARSADPANVSTNDEGGIIYNSTDKTIKVWDGSTWQRLVTSSGIPTEFDATVGPSGEFATVADALAAGRKRFLIVGPTTDTTALSFSNGSFYVFLLDRWTVTNTISLTTATLKIDGIDVPWQGPTANTTSPSVFEYQLSLDNTAILDFVDASSAVEFRNVVFHNSSATGTGRRLANWAQGTIAIENCSYYTTATSAITGPFIYCNGSDARLYINNMTIYGNAGTSLWIDGFSGSAYITNLTFEGTGFDANVLAGRFPYNTVINGIDLSQVSAAIQLVFRNGTSIESLIQSTTKATILDFEANVFANNVILNGGTINVNGGQCSLANVRCASLSIGSLSDSCTVTGCQVITSMTVDSSYNVITGNRVGGLTPGGSATITINGNSNLVTGNMTDIAIADNGTGNTVINNVVV